MQVRKYLAASQSRHMLEPGCTMQQKYQCYTKSALSARYVCRADTCCVQNRLQSVQTADLLQSVDNMFTCLSSSRPVTVRSAVMHSLTAATGSPRKRHAMPVSVVVCRPVNTGPEQPHSGRFRYGCIYIYTASSSPGFCDWFRSGRMSLTSAGIDPAQPRFTGA